MPTREQLIESLKKVFDPEINIDVWALGLIYDLKIEANEIVKMKMTLTTPMCPYGPALIDSVKEAIKKVNGVRDVVLDLVFDPPWVPSEELKMQLGLV